MSEDIDVVIVAFESRDVLPEAIESARSIRDVGEILVVDHGGDGSNMVATELGARAFADWTNPGFGAGQNRGARMTTAPLVLLLNPDARVEGVAVARGRALLEADPTIAAVQGTILSTRTGQPERSHGTTLGPLHLWGRALGLKWFLRFPWTRTVAARFGPVRDHAVRVVAAPTPVGALAMTAVLMRRAAFDAVGGFDERYFLYGEDLDLCQRLRSAGWNLVAIPDVWAWHADGSSSGDSWSRELEWWRGTLRYSALWFDRWAWAVTIGAAMLRAMALSLRAPRRARSVVAALVIEPWRTRRARPT